MDIIFGLLSVINIDYTAGEAVTTGTYIPAHDGVLIGNRTGMAGYLQNSNGTTVQHDQSHIFVIGY